MWFSFPEGADRITVEHQEFGVEHTDRAGRGYFRAPDHFAPRILMLKGFAQVSEPTEEFPEDLAPEDPQRDDAIRELAAVASSQKAELENLRSDYIAANAKASALETENVTLRRQLEESQTIIAELREDLEDAGHQPTTATTKA